MESSLIYVKSEHMNWSFEIILKILNIMAILIFTGDSPDRGSESTEGPNPSKVI